MAEETERPPLMIVCVMTDQTTAAAALSHAKRARWYAEVIGRGGLD